MLVIMMNSIREKMRSKTIYIVGGIGFGIILFLVLNGSFSLHGRTVSSYLELVPVMVIMVGFMASMLAITLSLQTIPKEFENKTCHLIFVRGVRPYAYALGLTLSNAAIAITSLILLYGSIITFNLIRGSEFIIMRHLGALSMMSLNVVVLSVLVSLLSTRLPLALNGLLGVAIYMLGSFHHMLSTYGNIVGGLVGWLIKGILYVIPNIYLVNKQIGAFIIGKPIDIRPILGQLFYIYVVVTLVLICFRKKEV